MLNSANTGFIQATIEIFGMLITCVIGVIFVLMTGKKKKSANNRITDDKDNNMSLAVFADGCTVYRTGKDRRKSI